MIVKGKPRSGPAQLAAYLMRVDDGEHPTLLHLDYGDDSLRKAFIEWDSIGELTRGEKTLYHAQIAPDDRTIMNAGKADDFAAIQAEEMAALKDRQKQHRTGIKGVLDAIQSKLNPTLAAEKAKEQRREITQLKARQAQERKDYLALIEQTKQLEIENLKERHALKRSDVERKHEEGTEQYIREHHEAKRILAEIEAKRIHEELEKKDNFREGPPPPKMGK